MNVGHFQKRDIKFSRVYRDHEQATKESSSITIQEVIDDLADGRGVPGAMRGVLFEIGGTINFAFFQTRKISKMFKNNEKIIIFG